MNKTLNKSHKGIKGTTCFAEHNRHKVACHNNTCRYWHQESNCQNCILIAAYDGPKTLQQIGDMFNVTRMRICQVEKLIFKKLFPEINNLNSSSKTKACHQIK
jgi:hypothetical protein